MTRLLEPPIELRLWRLSQKFFRQGFALPSASPDAQGKE
jgi:hypothetical protein